VHGLPPGSYRLRVETMDSGYIRKYYHNIYDYDSSELVETSINWSPSDIHFVLEVGGGISGTVIHISNNQNQAIEGLWVNAYDEESGHWVGKGQTGAGGPYYLRTDKSGADFLNEWWAGESSSPYCAAAVPIDPSAGGQAAKDFYIDRDVYPVARDDRATTVEDTAVSINVVDNDEEFQSNTRPDDSGSRPQPPEAVAGCPDQALIEGVQVLLSGSNSFDPDNDIAEYSWKQIWGQEVEFSDPDTAQPTFISPQVGPGGASLTFRLTVTDRLGQEDSAVCRVNVSWANDPPQAKAGADQTVGDDQFVVLDGSGSIDLDDGIQRYIWSQISGIKQVTLSDATSVKPTFMTPSVAAAGVEQLRFLLQVVDNGGLTDTAEVMIEVADNGIGGFSEEVLATTTVTDQYVGIAVMEESDPDKGGNLVSLSSLRPDSVFDTNGMPENLIYGLFDIKIKTYLVGGEIRLKIQLENPAPADYHWYKYSSRHGWYDYSAYAEFNAERNEVVITLVDGGIGDDDNFANGIIADPSGLGKAAQSTPVDSTDAGGGGGGGGGGCFIDSAGGENELIDLLSLLSRSSSPTLFVSCMLWIGMVWVGKRIRGKG